MIVTLFVNGLHYFTASSKFLCEQGLEHLIYINKAILLFSVRLLTAPVESAATMAVIIGLTSLPPLVSFFPEHDNRASYTSILYLKTVFLKKFSMG